MSDTLQKKFTIVALGCRTNQYETQAFKDQLVGMGYSEAQEGEAADLCIVNTCTVTESADSSSRHEIRQLARKHPSAKIAVTGCYAERNPAAVQAIEGVTHVVSNKDKEQLLQILYPEQEIPEFSITRFEAHTRAFVKVQDGCNSFCTYCIIPYVRGRSRSRSLPEIISEVESLRDNGYKEVVITGINVGDFDGNPEEGQAPARLAELIRAVDAVDGIERVRVSSIDPDEIDEELAEAILKGRKTCPSMHIVLQSGSNVILKRMNRKYTRQIFLETVHKLRAADPDFTFTTDVIVGFPGETEADFQETLDVMAEVRFAKVHMFPYSERPRTRAALYPNKVPPETIKERKQRVLRASEQYSFELRAQYAGRQMEILTESYSPELGSSGHTANFLEVLLPDVQLEANQLLKVKLIENTPKGLVGKLL